MTKLSKKITYSNAMDKNAHDQEIINYKTDKEEDKKDQE